MPGFLAHVLFLQIHCLTLRIIKQHSDKWLGFLHIVQQSIHLVYTDFHFLGLPFFK